MKKWPDDCFEEISAFLYAVGKKLIGAPLSSEVTDEKKISGI